VIGATGTPVYDFDKEDEIPVFTNILGKVV
jgi:hypothetical protein